MLDKSWSQSFEELQRDIAAGDGDAQLLRGFLFGLYELIRGGTVDVQNAFQRVTDDQLALGQRELAESLSKGQYVPGPSEAGLQVRVAEAAHLLRALEAALISLGELQRNPRRVEELSVSYRGAQGWVLPFPPRFRAAPADWPPYFAKRALSRLRCLNDTLPDGMRINLRLADVAFGVTISAAACLFDTLKLKDQDGKVITNGSTGPFIVSGIAKRSPATLEEALQSSCGKEFGADIVIYPELSVPPEDQAAISRLLGGRPWDKALNGRRPGLVVAGSWHQLDESGTLRNCAPVYDGGGTLIGQHAKHMIFGVKQGGGLLQENIVPAEEILVIVSRSLTVAVAICLDFCQVARANPYRALDVDLVLVTSLAGEKTTQEHEKQASELWAHRKTGTFLVQQDEEGAYGVSGVSPSEDGFVQHATAPVHVRKIFRPG